eukprot:SAG31_NODE_42646_length_270_cov_1.187135_1_plen_64_part_00
MVLPLTSQVVTWVLLMFTTIRGSFSSAGGFISTGSVFLTNLPTSQPAQANRVWNDRDSTLKIT